jgi:hypothetical protein
MKRALWLVSLAVLACSQPTPRPPIVDAAVVDVFTGSVANCRLEVVAVERDSAMPDVRGCLVSDAVDSCLVALAGQYRPDAVACVARDLGARANAAYLAGSSDPLDKRMADATRNWIVNHQLGYR